MIHRKIAQIKARLSEFGDYIYDINLIKGICATTLEFDRQNMIFTVEFIATDNITSEINVNASLFGQMIGDIAKQKGFIKFLSSHINSKPIMIITKDKDGNLVEQG